MTDLLNPGDVIDERYQIVSYIGKGGMQYVYKAHDLILDREVALKTPQNSSAEKRFKRSAVVAAKINHPNVAKTFDYFEADGKQYLIEELIEGTDIAKSLLQSVRYVDPYLVAKIFHYLSKGIAASHHAGVIHRDLKPTNIMVSGELQLTNIKITDFGIAKMAEEELVEAVEGGTDTISQSKTAVGALPYMSPEAIESPTEVSISTDIWSLGAMMYELLTGEKPFGQGLKAVSKILEAKQPDFPDFTINNPQFSYLSKQLIEVIRLCLQKNVNARLTADELVRHCSKFCYSISDRFTGVVKNTQCNNTQGFIAVDEGDDVFFHMDSVYGDKPSIGSKVYFSKFPGSPRWRAHPVICMRITAL